MSLIDDIDASTDRKEIANIGNAIANNRRRVERRTRNRITIIGAEHEFENKQQGRGNNTADFGRV